MLILVLMYTHRESTFMTTYNRSKRAMGFKCVVKFETIYSRNGFSVLFIKATNTLGTNTHTHTYTCRVLREWERMSENFSQFSVFDVPIPFKYSEISGLFKYK